MNQPTTNGTAIRSTRERANSPALDLTEDAVKQRLARGRKVLQESVLSFVEGALSRSTPGRVFTLGVLAALPAMATPAKAAGIGAAAAQGGFIAKSAGRATLLASVSGMVSAVLTLRSNLDQARTPRERRAVVKITVGVISLGTAGVGLVAFGCMAVGVKAYAWLCALGWQTAQGGGFAIARIAAEGPVAFGQHANDPIARQILTDPHAEQNQTIILIVITVLSLVPIAYYARAVRQRLGGRARLNQSGGG